MTKILILTDVHLITTPKNDEETDRLSRLERVIEREKGNVDLIVNNGDFHDGRDPRTEGLGHLETGLAILQQANVPIVNIIGNHEFNSTYADGHTVNGKYQKRDWIYPSDVYNLAKKNMDQFNFNISDHGKKQMYTSIDVGNIRVIGLNEYDVSGATDTATEVNEPAFGNPSISRQQMQWLSERLYSLPDSMQVLIVYHLPMFKSSKVPKNKANYLALIKAFNDSYRWSGTKEVADSYFDLSGLTADFSGHKAGRMLGCVSGHEHTDAMTYIDGIPHFMRLCLRSDWIFSKIPRKQKWGTDLAYDIAEVVDGKLRLTRKGAGDSVIL